MIVAIVYSLLFCIIIYKTQLFGIFKQTNLKPYQYTLFFILKLLAVPAFCFVYNKFYGNFLEFDAGIYFRDSREVFAFGKKYPLEYLKVLLGLQNDNPGSLFYKECISNTFNWDNGRVVDFFYNDNRILTRIHSLIHFVSFNSYFVHAVFSCFYGFVGITLLFKSIVEYFIRKELLLFIILLFVPSIWFFTGAVLKEPLMLLSLGVSVYFSKKLIFSFFEFTSLKIKLKHLSFLLFGLSLCFTIKPYLQLTCLGLFALFFLLEKLKIKRKKIIFISTLFFFAIAANCFSLVIRNKSLVNALLTQQSNFNGMAKGGIFLVDSTKFVRVDFNYNLVKKIEGNPTYYTIKNNVPYIYWEHTHQQDTLYCSGNKDTTHLYKLEYDLPEGGSNFEIEPRINIRSIFYAYVNTLFKPLFFNAKGVLQIVYSLENLLIIISLIILFVSIIFYFVTKKKETNRLFILCLLCCTLVVFLIIGVTTSNYGAIQRYRAPLVSFILISALHVIPKKFFNFKNLSNS